MRILKIGAVVDLLLLMDGFSMEQTQRFKEPLELFIVELILPELSEMEQTAAYIKKYMKQKE